MEYYYYHYDFFYDYDFLCHAKEMEKNQRSFLVKSVFVIVTFGLFMMTSLYLNQKKKEFEIEKDRKEALLKLTPLPGHKGVETGGDPKDPQAKTRRDFVKKVCLFDISRS